MSSLYQRVREARNKLGLSQESLAAELKVSRSAVAQWENEAGTRPSVENLVALARRSGMAFEYLATGRGARVFGAPIVAEAAPHYQVLTVQQQQLLACFDALSPRQRGSLLELLAPLAAR
ncbi:helix-turn-helix transcriptional regulator [Algiphilus sp. W345]|uniref:Helix-turn-helix transcriptional regulator n=1 Tax=Banduia mediterranea TaxID=3075609 RepID=A0ABU2WEE9_9GAMM|nr:helix-turn-helix transcriptional regulator [Algiphilus sp. W345]MDT0496238.1 helix-turn-helix transcriptional regulator [Algiphilus sp. W345]